jgi:16S rRNA (adenine1518-N6/adenine1519-N6)-dimethyltransferase
MLLFYSSRRRFLGSFRKVESLLSRTKRQLRRLNLRARKGLAQHFLIDEGVLDLIVSSAELTSDDVVLEVGPGLGVLSEELANRAAWLVAVELDRHLASNLERSLSKLHNVTIVNGDILDTPSLSLLEHVQKDVSAQASDYPRYKVVANLPYYITSAVIRHFLEVPPRPCLMVLMVQKEVAQAIAARPGKMSVLGISIQLYAMPEIIDYVPAHCFYPSPEVGSALVRLVCYPDPLVPVEKDSFFHLVRAGFTTSRKQMGNSLAVGLGLSKDKIRSWLTTAGIAPERRAETLAIEEWEKLWRVYIRDREEG